MTLIHARCSTCKVTYAHQNQTLEQVRLKVCPHCGRRTTVYEVDPGDDGRERVPVTTPPAIERISITDRTTETARRLVLAALEEE